MTYRKPLQKRCKDCHRQFVAKPRAYRRLRCDPCRAEHERYRRMQQLMRYRNRNRTKVLASLRAWKERNREYMREYNRRYYAEHQDEIRLRRKARDEANERGVSRESVLAEWGAL